MARIICKLAEAVLEIELPCRFIDSLDFDRADAELGSDVFRTS